MVVKDKEDIRWTAEETEFLVDRYIIEKPTLLGSLSSNLTNKDKQKAWERIVKDLQCEFPKGDMKTVKNTKKKWTNVLRYSRLKIQKYKHSISGTGGGKPFKLKPLEEKIMNQVIGRDNPALSGNFIPEGAPETEDFHKEASASDSENDGSSKSNSAAQLSPNGGYGNDSPLRMPSPGRLSDWDNSPPQPRPVPLEVVAIERDPDTGIFDALENPVPLKDRFESIRHDSRESQSVTPAAKKQKTSRPPLQETPLPSTSSNAARSNRISNAKVSASVRRAKVTTCEVSEQLAQKKLLKARMDVMKSVEETRKVRGEEKLSELEYPVDLWELLTCPFTAQL